MSLTPNCIPLKDTDLTPEQWEELSKTAHNLLMSDERKKHREEYFERMLQRIIKKYCNKDEKKQLRKDGIYKN